MIPFDFEYYKPDTIYEAVRLFQYLDSRGKEPLYYGGGTEIISMGRKNDIHTGAVIDIKGIPECNIFRIQNDYIVAGAALTLTGISEVNLFPLLSKASTKAADHTVRNKLTLGGNICGKIIYREAVQPFLICDSIAVIAGVNGLKYLPINQIFDGKLRINNGELLVQLIIAAEYIRMPFVSVKKTRLEEIDYPLVSIAALKKDGYIRAAFSGVCPFPFRSVKVEEELNNRSVPLELRIENAMKSLPAPVMGGISGSSGYRKFVLKNTLIDIMTELGVM